MNIVERVARSVWRPPSRVPPWKWAEEHITVDKTSPFPGKFRSDTAPWTRELMEVFADNRISDIAAMCAAQSAKTQTMVILLAWAIAEDPGSVMWVMAAQDEAKTFARTRMMPTLENCEPVRRQFPAARFEKTTLEINFPNAPLIINGANSQSKLQSKPIRWLFLDEVRNYPPGAFEMVLKRTTAFWNARRVVISTPDVEGDAVHRNFLAGDQRYFYVGCPECGQQQSLKFAQLKWDENEITRPNGEWNFDELTKTIRYEFTCGHSIKDTFAERRKLALSGVWVKHNKNAPANRVSFTWSALLPPWVRWRNIVEEFLRAKAALELGATDPMKAFINETLGEPWREQSLYEQEIVAGKYKFGDEWPDGFIRFLTVDKQKDCYWFVCRAWARNGSSRLVAYERVHTWEDIKAAQDRLGVAAKAVIVDSGFATNEVYEQCCKYGWTAFKGEDRENFPHYLENGLRVLRAFSTIQAGDPGMGTHLQGARACPLFLWSNPTVKDILWRLKLGKGALWEIPSNIGKDYTEQLNSEAKVKTINKQTGFAVWKWIVIGRRPNHLWDCECMQVVCAMMAEILDCETVKKTIDLGSRTSSD